MSSLFDKDAFIKESLVYRGYGSSYQQRFKILTAGICYVVGRFKNIRNPIALYHNVIVQE